MLTRRDIIGAWVVASALTLASCSEAPSAASHATMHGTNPFIASVASPGLLKEVHSATGTFPLDDPGQRSRYAVSSPCVAHEALGGMGFHWVNGAKVDRVFNALEPEALLVAPNAHGELKLVAVEYIVIDAGQRPPTFDGRPFDVRGTPVPAPHWSLHVWIHKDNPAGTFTPFNPAVSCPT